MALREPRARAAVRYQNLRQPALASRSGQVVGTGFLVRNTTVITNRHVVEDLVDQQARLGFPSSQLFLSFVVPAPNSELRNTVRMIRHYGVLGNQEVDVGFVEFHIVHKPHFEGIVPLQVVDSLDLHVSEEIAVYGYPYGTAMLERNRKIYRWGPVIQQGWISGIYDEGLLEKTGKAFACAELANHYGFTDIDGLQPPVIRSQADAAAALPSLFNQSPV